MSALFSPPNCQGLSAELLPLFGAIPTPVAVSIVATAMEAPSNNKEHLGQVAMDLMMYQSCSNGAKHRKEGEKEKQDRKKAESGNLKSGIEPQSEKPGQHKHGDAVTAGSHQQAEVMDICKEVTDADAEVIAPFQRETDVQVQLINASGAVGGLHFTTER